MMCKRKRKDNTMPTIAPTVEERVKRILQDQLGIDEASASDRTKNWKDLGADELDTVEVIMACEEEFAIHIDEDEADHATTVGELIDLVTKKYNE